MISDTQIIQELLEKESSLVKQLNKVRIALAAFVDDDIDPFNDLPIKSEPSVFKDDFDQYLSYDQRVIYALMAIKIGYIDNMVECLLSNGDQTPKDKLYSGLTGAASRLYRRGILKADTRGKKYKYSFNDTAEAEKERAEILPFD